MSDKEEKPTVEVAEKKEEKKLMMTRQTIKAADYKEEATKFLKEGNIGKAIMRYQLCRMNTQQTAIQKTKEDIKYDKWKAEKAAKKAEEEAERKQIEAERRKASGEPEEEEEEPQQPQMSPEQQQQMAMMQGQMGAAGGPPGGMMPPGGPGGMPGMPPGMGGDPMSMMGAMGGGQSSSSDDEIHVCRHLYLTSLNNLAHCFMQKEDFSRCIEVATEAIGFDGRCSKAYYRRGIAWTKKGNATRGSEDLQVALDLNPGDAGIVEMLNWSKSMILQEKVNEKKAMARMFS